MNLSLTTEPRTIEDVSNILQLKINDKNIFDITNPKILIAGCGTGLQSISAKQKFKQAEVLAIEKAIAVWRMLNESRGNLTSKIFPTCKQTYWI